MDPRPTPIGYENTGLVGSFGGCENSAVILSCLAWMKDLANASATPVTSSSSANNCRTSSSSELESAAAGAAVDGAGSVKITLLSDVDAGGPAVAAASPSFGL